MGAIINMDKIDWSLVSSIWIASIVSVLAIGYRWGENAEHQRIYERCLVDNDTLAHHEVVYKCKEFVK